MQRGSLEPWIKDEVEYHPWQIEGVRILAHRPSYLLADEMGLGKSFQALTVFAIDVYMKIGTSCIIVCPPTLIANWMNEISKFTRFKALVLDGSPDKRNQILVEFALMENPKILVTNYEKIDKHLKFLNSLQFSHGIFDEAHYLKGHNSKRTKACHALNNGRTALLTGTPMLGHVSDLWGLLYKIDPNSIPPYWTFVNQYAVFGGYKQKQIVGIKNEKRLRALLDKYQLRRLAKDHLGLDKPFIVPRIISMTPAQRTIYDKMKTDLKVPRPEDAADEDITNALVKFTRLKQVCTNTLAFNGEDVSPKLDLCIEDDAEIYENGEKVIVFTQFREVQASYIKRHIDKHGKAIPHFVINGDTPQNKRQSIVNDWSAVSGPAVIVCMIQVAGIGLNMIASHNIAFIDKLFVPGLNAQAISRAHRLGQVAPVTVREYRVRDSVEDRVEKINTTKIKNFEKLIEGSPEWKKALMELLIKQDRIEDAA